MVFDAAIPIRGISDSTPLEAAGISIGKTYAGTVIRVRHKGPYRNLIQTHRKITAYLAALGIERNGDAWESYVSDPTKVPESEILNDLSTRFASASLLDRFDQKRRYRFEVFVTKLQLG